MATTPVCHRLPRSKIATSAVPPPMSTSATPSSFSSGVSTASAAASCSITGSATATPARLTQATMFCVDDTEPVITCTLTSRRAPVMPTGAPMPSCSSTTKSCGSTCRISRPVGRATALAASIARRTSSRVISRFFPATAMTPRLLNPFTCGPDSARCTESTSMPAISSASSIAFLIESTAPSRLTTTPRLIPRDSATPIPTMSRLPSSSVSPTMQTTADVPTSSPTTYRSLRAMRLLLFLPPEGGSHRRCALVPRCALLPRCARLDEHVVAEPQVHRIDPGNVLVQSLREVEIRLHAIGEVVVAGVKLDAVVLQNHHGIVRVRHIHLRDLLRQIGTTLKIGEHTASQRRVPISRPVRVISLRRQTVDERQVELGV